MRTDHYYESQGQGQIHFCAWSPEGTPKAVVQIVHGIAEYAQRYDDFANYLNSFGILVVAEDHMGHGKSMETGTRGYFAGGWSAAVADTYRLLELTRAVHPDIPYVLFGHSMGSFMVRTVLAQYPHSGIAAAILCGTGWIPEAVLLAGKAACGLTVRLNGPGKPSKAMQSLAFGGYLKRVEHPRTGSDWLSRDAQQVDAYEADPLCGFVPSADLLGDMMGGMLYNQRMQTLAEMDRALPVRFIAGGDDPVGNYGSGVEKTIKAFRKAGMQKVSGKIYPLCRHEILNEINRQEVYEDVIFWLREQGILS